jgi:hypothetical protein
VRTLSKIPVFTRISWQAFSARCCNTSKTLIGAEYTKVCRCPHSQRSRRLRSGDRAGHLSGPRVLSTVHRKSGPGAVWQCGENEMVSHHAWTPCVVVDEEAHVSRVVVNHSPKKRRYTAPVSLLGRTTGVGHLRCLARHWIAHISTGIGFWTYVDWDFRTHLSEYCTPLKPLTLLLSPCTELSGRPKDTITSRNKRGRLND